MMKRVRLGPHDYDDWKQFQKYGYCLRENFLLAHKVRKFGGQFTIQDDENVRWITDPKLKKQKLKLKPKRRTVDR